MLKRFRRWHFDLAFFLGLAIFSWAYWYSKPRPVWTSFYPTEEYGAKYSFNLLGYSADSKSIYTTCESKALSKNWAIPQIQKWCTQTGEMLADYLVEMPEDDRFQLQLPRPHLGSSYSVTLCSDPRYFLVRYEQSKQKDHHYLRLYRIDGKPVGQGLEVHRFFRVEYLTDATKSDRHFVVSFELNPKIIELPISVIDLDSGKTVRTPQTYARGKLGAFPLISGGRHLVFVLKATETTPIQMVIVDLQTGENQGRIQATSRFAQLLPNDDTHYAICAMIGEIDSFSSRLDFYRYDPITKNIEPDPSHPLDGLTSAPMQWYGFKPPHLVIATQSRNKPNNSEFIKVILGWLARIGIVREYNSSTKYRIADLATGQPLRQITFDGHPSPDWRSIVTTTRSPKDEPGLSLYTIPHYLWEPTLSWMQWLSWLLVFPWPIRYFIASRNESYLRNQA